MNRNNRDLEYLRRLTESLQRYQKEIADLETKLRECQMAVQRARKDLAIAKQFQEMERKRLHLTAQQIEVPSEEHAVYAGLAIKEACIRALKVHGVMTLEQLETELTDGGFVFRGSPKRTINMALLSRSSVERLPEGRFRLKEQEPLHDKQHAS